MQSKENTINRMKEIIDKYKQVKRRMRGQQVDASKRKLIQKMRHDALEELETLIVRL